MSDDFDITLERKLESKADARGGGVTDVRRIELITGAGRRRRWSSEDKARIVVESLEPGARMVVAVICPTFDCSLSEPHGSDGSPLIGLESWTEVL